MELCNEIFLLERKFEGKDERGAQVKDPLTQKDRQNQRQERLKPILDGLFAWLKDLPVSGGTKLAKAVQYCLNEKPYLYRCLEDGNIPVDNNRAENAIRPFVVGLKELAVCPFRQGRAGERDHIFSCRYSHGERTECGGIFYTLVPL